MQLTSYMYYDFGRNVSIDTTIDMPVYVFRKVQMVFPKHVNKCLKIPILAMLKIVEEKSWVCFVHLH